MDGVESKSLKWLNVCQVLKSHDFLIWAYIYPEEQLNKHPSSPSASTSAQHAPEMGCGDGDLRTMRRVMGASFSAIY